MLLPANALVEMDKLYHKRNHVELTVGILKDGTTDVLFFGPDRKAKKDGSLVYPVGSICKPYTASLAAKYVSEGKLDLDAPISAYIKDLPDQYYPSLRKLATHTSGYKTQPYTLLTSLPFFIRMTAVRMLSFGVLISLPKSGDCGRMHFLVVYGVCRNAATWSASPNSSHSAVR